MREQLKSKTSNLYFKAAITATLLVIYGSLIPFEPRLNDLTTAFEIFTNISYLQLGVQSRADLLANALIYIPVSFLWMGAFSSNKTKNTDLKRPFAICISIFAIAITVEFIQIFISPRTVSKNDIIAEGIGIAIGVGFWQLLGARTSSLMNKIKNKRRLSTNALFICYFSAYFAYTLIPFDFYISTSELSNAFSSKGIPLFPTTQDNVFVSLRDFATTSIKLLAAVILGLLAKKSKLFFKTQTKKLVFIFFLIFIAIEFVQFFEYSGRSSILLAIIKTAGFTIGIYLPSMIALRPISRYTGSLHILLLIIALPYLLLVLSLKNWTLAPVFDLEMIVHHLRDISYLPFYYHYFTSEVDALKSLMWHTALIMPVSTFYWLRSVNGSESPHTLHLVQVGALIGCFLELGGLIWAGLRPDPTNVLVIATALPVGYQFIGLMFRTLTESDAGNSYVSAPPDSKLPGTSDYACKDIPKATTRRPTTTSILISIVSLAAALAYFFNYPLSKTTLSLLALGYSLLLIKKPNAWLYVIPISIPTFDLYPLSGRFFLTEFDFILLITLSIKYSLGHVVRKKLIDDRLFYLLLILLIATYIISLSKLLIPLPPIDVTAFTSFYSPFNGLRLSKGLLWAALLLPVLRYECSSDVLSYFRIGQGMILSLIALCIVVLIERHLFTGLFEQSDSLHRVRGSFSSMNSGGAHIDAYLITALPFLVVPLLLRVTWQRAIAYGFCFFLTLYCIFVTYSRAPYIITPIIILVLIAGIKLSTKRPVPPKKIVALVMAGTSVCVAWVAVPFLFDSFLSERLSIIAQDKDTRFWQWERTMEITNKSLSNQIIGAGPGTFPLNLMLHIQDSDRRSAIHELATEANNTFIKLSSGSNIYTNQYVSVLPGNSYMFRFHYRSSTDKARLFFPICEKWIADSLSCEWNSRVLSKSKKWTLVETPLVLNPDSFKPDRAGFLLTPPTTLSLHVSNTSEFVDIDNVELLDSSGSNMINNGGFENKKDHWYFTSDNHLAWHAKNLFIGIYHDLGVLGILTVTGLSVLIFWRLITMIFSAEPFAAVLLSALSGFFGIGMIGSLFDAPQLTFLYFILVFLSQALWEDFNHNKT